MPVRTSIDSFLSDRYTEVDLDELEALLGTRDTLTIRPHPNGLVPAAPTLPADSPSGYQNYWLRDNALIGLALIALGDVPTALQISAALTRRLQQETSRIERIVATPALKEDVQLRVHVRWPRSGEGGRWSHAQNDALGYFLKLRFAVARLGHAPMSAEELSSSVLLVRYLAAIEYWCDADSGAWEEDRKVNSSSVGAVLSGLLEMSEWLERHPQREAGEVPTLVADLIARGRRRLDEALPAESPPQRAADAALLLLLYPASVVTPSQEDAILRVTETELVREVGVIRYSGDSYYGQDYPEWFPPDQLSASFSEDVAARNARLQPGLEAQWCLFDSLLSVIRGHRFATRGTRREDLERQVHHFNRALRQLTRELRCPELYYSSHGTWTPSPHSPLAWAQANLALAMSAMRRSVTLLRGGR